MDDLLKWILERVKAGDTLPVIAQALGIATDEVQAAVNGWIIERIYEGDSQADIARTLQRSTGCVSMWLDCDPATVERSARARAASAEAWLDKGIEMVRNAIFDPSFKGEGMDAGAARAYAQECARRAAIRNPAYREKTGVEITGKDGGPIRTIGATVSPEVAAATYKDIMG